MKRNWKLLVCLLMAMLLISIIIAGLMYRGLEARARTRLTSYKVQQ